MKVIVEITFTLEKVVGSEAFYKFEQVLLPNEINELRNVFITGLGSGYTVYDISRKYVVRHNNDLNVDLKMEEAGAQVNLKMVSNYKSLVTIRGMQ